MNRGLKIRSMTWRALNIRPYCGGDAAVVLEEEDAMGGVESMFGSKKKKKKGGLSKLGGAAAAASAAMAGMGKAPSLDSVLGKLAGLTLVHFSALPEPFWSLKFPETTQHIPLKTLTSSRKVDERKGLPLVHCFAQSELLFVTVTHKQPNVSH